MLTAPLVRSESATNRTRGVDSGTSEADDGRTSPAPASLARGDGAGQEPLLHPAPAASSGPLRPVRASRCATARTTVATRAYTRSVRRGRSAVVAAHPRPQP